MAVVEKEIWKDIPKWEGFYQASTHGRIKSCKRTVFHQYTGHMTIKEKILKPGLDKNGYPLIVLHKNNKPKTCKVHKLILLTFEGPCPEGMECCHNDGVRTNNYYSNLRYDTHKNNQADMRKHNTYQYGEKHPKCKLTEKQVWGIRLLLASGKYLQREIAEKFNVSQLTISAIKTGKNWSQLK